MLTKSITITGGLLLITFMMTTLLNLYITKVEARPWDLYDEVSDLFQAMTLDDVPGAKETKENEPKDFCRMPARKGVCRALIPRWSYDPQQKDCIEFKFGGCDGNDNNFPSYKSCMATCKGILGYVINSKAFVYKIVHQRCANRKTPNSSMTSNGAEVQ
uniref:BPTI/Kunitz inhibitor domain-containing protein n=1 Tax=Glossina brevipalpis TaxID=37001 RepID=A0A1A9X3C5_9MUSC